MKTIVFLFSSICYWFIVNGSVTIQGSSSIILKETDVVITCSVTSVSFIFWVSMYKNSTDNNLGFVQIATIGGPSPDGKLTGSLTSRGGASLTGSSLQTTAATLKLTISKDNVRCNDEAMYQCKSSVIVQTNGPTVTQTSNTNVAVKITAKPTSIDALSRQPAGTAVTNEQKTYRYDVGTVVTISCSSTVGRPAQNHRWCKKGPNDPDWLGFPDASVINQNMRLDYQASTCDYKRTSTLTFNVTAADTKVEIMCEPEDGTNFFCGSSNLKEQMILRNNVNDNTNTGGQTEEDPQTSNAGVIAGAVVGVIAGIILIAIIVYFVAVRGRNSGETYRTEEDGSPGGPVQKEGPVYSVPDKKGTNKGRQAHENKGMDEPQTRTRYSPDRNNSHTNKAMYDDDSQDYDNDRDGNVTPDRSGGYPAEGFGSAV